MFLPLIGLAAQFIPELVGMFAGNKAQDIAQSVVGIAQTVTNSSTPEAALGALNADPNLMLQYQQALLAQKSSIVASIEAAKTAQIQAVNATMQVEDQTHRGGWREACGWVVAGGSMLGIVATCYLFYQALIMQNVQAVGLVPTLTIAITTLLAVPGSAVGIVAWHEGKVNQIQAAQP